MTRLERQRWLAAGLLAVLALVLVGTAPVLAAAKARNGAVPTITSANTASNPAASQR